MCSVPSELPIPDSAGEGEGYGRRLPESYVLNLYAS